jgi:hypothetical protein
MEDLFQLTRGSNICKKSNLKSGPVFGGLTLTYPLIYAEIDIE